MRSLTLQFAGSQRRTLHGVLELPAAPRAFAVWIPGFTASGATKMAVQLSRRLAQQGFAVLRLDLAGTGRSEGDPATATFDDYCDDVRGAIAMLTQRFRTPTVLMGHSLGGCVARAVAADGPPIQGVVALAAPTCPAALPELLFTAEERAAIAAEGVVTMTLFGQRWPVSAAFLASLPDHLPPMPQRQLLLHGGRDAVIPPSHSRQVAAAGGEAVDMHWLPDGDHLLTTPAALAEAAEWIALWCGRYADVPDDGPLMGATGQVVAQWRGLPWRTVVQADGRRLVADESTLLGGQDDGHRPLSLLQAALASSAAMTVAMQATQAGIDPGAVTVTVELAGRDGAGRLQLTRQIAVADTAFAAAAAWLAEHDPLGAVSRGDLVVADAVVVQAPASI